MNDGTRSAAEATMAPAADDETKPDSPTDLTKRSWSYVFKRSLREFKRDEAVDTAAALTFFGVLALFPALVALLSIIGLMGDPQQAVATILDIVRQAGSASTADTLEPVLNQLAESRSAGLALVIGIASALWSASGYVGAFGRGMNRIYQMDEGRSFVEFRGKMLLVTAALLIMASLVLVGIALSGSAADAVGEAVGMSTTAVTVWSIAKWPVILLLVVAMIALLYWATPNVKQPKIRWISVGSAIAIVVWALASAAFAIYVANFSNFNQTYGTLAGAIIFLLWLWITNLALMFGAEVDAEIERNRELQAGIAAEDKVQLPARDTEKITEHEQQEREDIQEGREIRLEHSKRTRASNKQP